MTPNPSNIRHGYTLATWLQRLVAHLIDRLIVGAIILAGLLGVTAAWIASTGNGKPEFDWGQFNGVTLEAWWGWALATAAAVAFLIYAIWFLSALGGGQTPGKQVVGVRVMRTNGEPFDWGHTFLREFFIEWIVVGFLSAMTGGIFYVVNYVWPLWDKDRQALHDKMVETLVVEA